MENEYRACLEEIVDSANTGLDAIKRAPIVDYNTGIRCLRIQDISQKKEFNNWGYCKVETRNFDKFQLKRNDIIIARTGATIGVNRFISNNLTAVYNNGLIRLRINEKVAYPQYVYYCMQTQRYRDFINSICAGTSTQPNMKINAFLEFEIYLPNIATQKSIVKILTALDEKVDNNNQINSNFEKQAQAMFQSLFVENINPNWPVGTISDLGVVIGGSTPSKAKPEYYTNNGIAWITPKDLSNDKSKFISHGEIDITELGLKNSSASKMPKGTVLFSSRAPIGYIAIAKGVVTTNQGFKSIIPHSHIGTAFVYCFLKHNLSTIENMASGSTFKEISGSVMKSVPAQIPSVELLQHFTNFCAPIFEQQELLEHENRILTEIRDSLLAKLTSGDLDVSNIDI